MGIQKPIRVLHFSSLLAGAAYFNNLWEQTDHDRVTYVFATFTGEGEFSRQLEERGAPVYKMGIAKVNENIDWPDLPRAYRPLAEIVEKEKIDVIHPHLVFPTLLGVTLAKIKGKKSVFTRHHSDAIQALKGTAKRNFYLMIERYLNRQSNHIIAPSRMVRDILINDEGVAPEKVSLIPYGQTFERFAEVTPEIVAQKRAELKMDGNITLICVSRLFERKGHIYLFEALASLLREGLKAKLYLLGTGDYETVLRSKLKELGIEGDVEFLGFQQNILPIIACADIIVHPSLEDALSQSLIESLMLGRPIVATDISGAADTLDGGKYGKLVEPANSKAFEKGLRETIDDLEGAIERARNGKSYLLDYMSAKRTSNEYVECYEKVMRK